MLNSYDFEFYEDGQTIQKISLGIATEHYDFNKTPGENVKLKNALYIVFPRTEEYMTKSHKYLWLQQNVMPHLYVPSDMKFSSVVNSEAEAMVLVDEFFKNQGEQVELIADYGAYDHVALCQLFGTMMDIPKYLPYYSNDLQYKVASLKSYLKQAVEIFPSADPPTFQQVQSAVEVKWADCKPHEYVEHNALMDAIKTLFFYRNYAELGA